MDLRDRGIVDHLLHDEKGIVIDQPHIGEASFGYAVADDEVVVQRLLDTDEVRLRLLGSGGDEETPLALPDLQDDRPVVAEHLAEIEANEPRFPGIDREAAVKHARRA